MSQLRTPRTPREMVANPCRLDDHDTNESAQCCGRCGVVLCDLCGSDEHFTSQGHDLSHPAYWGI
jgi:hypothetical protein